MQPYLIFASFNGALSIALGAFAAHAFRATASVSQLNVLSTASQYQLVHAVIIFSVFCLLQIKPNQWLQWSLRALSLGVVLFCGSLYFMAFTWIKDFAWVTPIGGAFLLIGWMLLLVAGLRYK